MTTRQPLLLLVDHSRGSLMFQETVLRRSENEILTAQSSAEAMEIMRQRRPDLVVFGFRLEDMNAPDFCRAIRADDDLKKVSLLFIGDKGREEQTDLCMAAGCNDIVYRPIHRQELDEKIARLTSIPVRREVRTLTKLEVIEESGGSPFTLGHSINVSTSGMLLEASKPLPPDARLRLQFFLASDSVPVRLEAKVVRAEHDGSAPRYGVEFVGVDDPTRERLRRFVDRTRAKEMSNAAR